MPSVPAPKGFHFENVEAYRTRQALAAEIRETVEALIASTYVSGYLDTLRKYLAAIEPGTVRDFARLPVPASSPCDARGRTNIACVYAKLSFLIQLFWDQALDGTNNAGVIRGHLADLRAWAAHGIDKCVRVGNEREGWTLQA
ncbi:MAG: hypothetical protein ABFD89_12635 [Bryobacteraceae bacterium]